MNVGGVPWTEQNKNPRNWDGFMNVNADMYCDLATSINVLLVSFVIFSWDDMES